MTAEKTKVTNFVALTEKRNIIAALHDGLGKWLSGYNRYSQLAQDLYREEEKLVLTASGLISDAEIFIDRAKTEVAEEYNEPNITLPNNELAEDSMLSTDSVVVGSDSESLNAEELFASQFDESVKTELEKSDQPSLDKKLLKGLQLFDALKKYLSLTGEKQTVPDIISRMHEYGFRSEVKHPYESVRGMLRYYEKQGVFERDGATWGIASNDENNTVIKFVPKAELLSQDKMTDGKTPQNFGKLTAKSKSLSSETKTNPEYCEEILRKSGQPWLHVDQILVILKNDYGIIRSKEIVAAALRKNARNKRIFKAYPGNRFGLLVALATETAAFAPDTSQDVARSTA